MSDEGANTAVDDQTLYAMIVEATGIDYDAEKFESIEAYKLHIVDFYADETAVNEGTDDETTLGDQRFEEAPEEVCAWVDAATKVAKANKSARRKKSLPLIDGLEDEAEPEAEPRSRRTRRTRGERAPAKEKEPPPERDRTDNRYGHTSRLLFKDPDMDFDDVMKELNRQGHDYADITVKRAFDAFAIFYAVGIEMGVIKK